MENIINQQVGARVACMRGEMGMTQADLAAAMSTRLGRDIRPLTITRLEGGKRPIGVDELTAAASALNVSAADLLTDGDLPFRAVRAMGAGETLLRASDDLHKAVVEWMWARSRLSQRLRDPKVRESLPAVQQMWLSTLSQQALEDIIKEAHDTATSEVRDDEARRMGDRTIDDLIAEMEAGDDASET